MLLESYRAMSRYNRWMNEKLFALAAELSDEERTRDEGAFFGSLEGTLGHLLLADRVWLGRFTGQPERFVTRDTTGAVVGGTALRAGTFATFEDFRRERTLTDDALDAYFGSLDEAALARDFSYKTLAGVPFDHPLWVALTHCQNHQTHHRGQATTVLFRLGKDPGSTDFLAMMRAR